MSSYAVRVPLTTIADLLQLLTREPGRPRITWYGTDGERVELSGAVLENWVSKTANLLVEEFDAGPGTRVRIDLPGHWRTVVWAFASWRVGACVVAVDDGPTDVVVTDRPGEHVGAPDLVAVTLPALARRFAGELPPSAVDAATAVMTYGDVLGWSPPVDAASPALVDASGTWTHATLPDHPTVAKAPRDSGRTALVADASSLLATLAVLADGGSVVLIAPDALARLAAGPGRLDALLGSEQVSTDLLRGSASDA